MKISEVFGQSNMKLLKSISSSGKSIFIDFTKVLGTGIGIVEFSVSIKYNEIKPYCKTWLSHSNNVLMFPHQSNEYVNCSWLITANYGYYIKLDFNYIRVHFLVDNYFVFKDRFVIYIGMYLL